VSIAAKDWRARSFNNVALADGDRMASLFVSHQSGDSLSGKMAEWVSESLPREVNPHIDLGGF
jgi:hypothetical protein